ncbi:MAG: hypothetical protein DMD99_09200 [Candidatus Rokuibacteriota bacterium]|nr:MAG: hypothetical protein DMD99_09200 [Candidatus Rokubacteria bacterium]
MSVALSLRPLGKALGTEVVGVDVSRPFDVATLEWIDRAFAEHPVMVFRNQRLGPAELAAFGAQFGRPQPHILEQYRHPDRTDVSYITNVDKAGGIDRFGVTRASTWHTDETYEDALPRLAILHALEVPSAKGGTMFADMRAAYDALPEAMRRRLGGLVGLHGRTNGPDGVNLYGETYVRASEKMRPERRHPAVKKHPVTGRPVLFVNPTHTSVRESRGPRRARPRTISSLLIASCVVGGPSTTSLDGSPATHVAQLVVLQRMRAERGLRPRHGNVRPFDRVPEDGVQDLGIRLVGPIKGQLLGVFGAIRVLLIDLAERLVGLESFVGRECWRVLEGGDHWSRCRVELTHRWETEDEFHGPQHRDRGVHAVVDDASSYVGRGDQAHGAMGVDMVRSILRVILHDEDGRLPPDRRA